VADFHGINFAKMVSMETNTTAKVAWLQGRKYALKHLQDLGLKFFPQISGLDEDYRIMIPSQEIIVSKDLATETFQVTITISDR
jgi:hypothetical protein